MRIGISTGCLYPSDTGRSLDLLMNEGFRIFEIFFNTFSEIEPDYLNLLFNRATQFNAEICSVHPFTSSFESFLLFSGYEKRFLDGLGFYEMYFRTAKRIGADKVVLHGLQDCFASAISEEEYFRRFAMLSERAGQYGIKLLQENVYKFRCNDPEFIKKMIKNIPNHAGFVLDVKQALMAGIEPSEMALLMDERLRHIHISDRDENGKCVLPGKGCADLAGFIRTLESIGYNGDIIIEVYRSSFGSIGELWDSYCWLKEINGRCSK